MRHTSKSVTQTAAIFRDKMSPFIDYVQNIITDRKTITKTGLAENKQIEIEVRFTKSNLDPIRVRALFNDYDPSTETTTTEHSLGTKGVVRKRYVMESGVVETKEPICSSSFGPFSVHSTIETVYKEDAQKIRRDSNPRRKQRRSKETDGYRIDVTRVTMSGKSDWELEIEILSNSIDVPTFEGIVMDMVRERTIDRKTPETIPIGAFLPVDVSDRVVAGWTKPKDAYVHDFTNWHGGIFQYPVYVTAKLNGVRCIVWIDGGNVYKSSETEAMHYVGRTGGPNCVLDCESYGRRIYPFDIISLLGQNVAYRPFRWRLRRLMRVLMRCKFGHKPQYMAKDHDDILKCIASIDKHAQERDLTTDGYIFTPSTGKYSSQPFKWKEVSTVDVRITDNVAYARGGNAGDVVLSYAVAGTHADGIYECTIDPTTKTFSVLKGRPDKTHPNSTILVENMIRAHETKTILYRDGLLGVNHQLFTSYHNRFKRKVLSRFSGVLLDIGSGVGGDLSKWGKCTHVHAVEPWKPSYDELVSRIASRTRRVTPYNCRGEDFDIASVTQIETVSMFFVLNMMTIKMFAKMLQNFSRHANSFAAGKIKIELTFMDCTDIDTKMDTEKTNVLDFGFARIERKGDKIITTIHNTRVVDLEETRIRMADLEKCATLNNYEICRCQLLNDETILSANQKVMSSFYKYVILRKSSWEDM